MWRVILLVLVGVASSSSAMGEQATVVERWGMFEVAVSNSKAYANPFTDVALEGTFTSPSGKQIEVSGFYDGGQTWRLRFMPDEIGEWRYEAKFTDGSPGSAGTFMCIAGKLRGPLRVRKDNPLWFEHADGAPFYLRSFLLWCIDALDEKTLADTLDWLKAQGFNTIDGPHLLFGKPHSGRPRGHADDDGSGRLPWRRNADGSIDFAAFNLTVWQNLDRALRKLEERGMVILPFSVLGGTNGLPKPPTKELQDLLLRYWVARWGGFWNATYQPVSEWWEGYSEKEMQEIGRTIKELDGGRHLISVHSIDTGVCNHSLQRADWYSYHTVQDKLENWNPTKYTWFVDLHRRFAKPIGSQECFWEGNRYQKEAGLDMDNMRRGAWVTALCGGQISYADEVVLPRQCERGEEGVFSGLGLAIKPRGLFYPYLKTLGDFIESLPFWRMTPQPKLSNTGICLAEVGHEYVIYSPNGGVITLDLTSAKGSFVGRWLNPRTGKFSKPLEVKSGGRRAFTAPDGDDWALEVKRR